MDCFDPNCLSGLVWSGLAWLQLLVFQTVNNNVLVPSQAEGDATKPREDIRTARVPLKEISAYLTLLEGGKPEDKLECEF